MGLSLASSAGSWRHYCANPDAVDSRLRTALDAGRPIVLTSRFSTPTGENARTSAINTLFEAARVLARQSGIDVTRALPNREELDVRLRNAPVTRSKRLGEGKDIQHRFVTLDLRPNVPAVILMATGSGRLTAEGFVQPFAQRAAELVWEQQAALVVTKRWDRNTRNDDMAGPLIHSMAQHQTWVCTDKMFREMNHETRLLLMVESFTAGANTGGEDRAKRLGQADRTERQLISGQVAYHLPSRPPPGMGVATMKRRPNLRVDKVAYLDMPGCRPDPAYVAEGLSDVRADDGEVVDQVANIRFFLAHYGEPEWMENDRLLKEMARRKFSTVFVRSLYGADAHMSATRGHTAWQSILDNLDVFETGVLRRSLGGDVPDVEITGVFPPDGAWATPERFAEIRAYRRRSKERAGARVRLPLSALKASYNGVECKTRSVASASTVHSDEPCLAFVKRLASGHESRVTEHVLLPWATFAESLADAIIGAGSQSLQRLLDGVAAAEDASAAGLEVGIAEADEQLVLLDRRMAGLVANLGETDADGTPILHGALLSAVQRQHEELEQQVTATRQHRGDLVAQLSAETPKADGADPALLPHLLASLKEPTDRTYLKLWQRTISSLSFTTAPSPHPGKASRVLHWHGAIKLDAGADGTVIIPFEGSYDYHRVHATHNRRHVDRQDDYIAAMKTGEPFDAVALAARRANRPRVARQLGIEDGHPLFSCDDPSIVAAATAMLLHEQDSSAPLPSGDPGFLAAVHRVHVEDRSARPWRRTYGAIVTAFYVLAAATGTVLVNDIVERCQTTRGTVHSAFSTLRRQDPNWASQRKQGYRLEPCTSCGSHDRRPAEIAEVTGLMCRNCGLDEAGVAWDLTIYARYLA